jgi:ParB-like chromosome segregation protein Spo0J
VAKIAASMAKFGWTVPCMVADDGELIAGMAGCWPPPCWG